MKGFERLHKWSSVRIRSSNDRASFKSEKAYLWLLLSLGLVRGLIYLSVMPPWQHYDEPTHFERLYWLTESLSSSTPAARALSLPAEISASMCEFHFWKDGVCSPLPLPYEQPPTLKALVLTRYPLYYYLGVPLQIAFRHLSVEFRLYVGRLVSVVLYLLTLLVAYLIVRDLFPRDREIRWTVPALLALIPAFTEEMSALNNDAAAVLTFSFLLWGIVRLMRDGFSILSLVWVSGAAVLAWSVKRTTMVGVLLGFVAILAACRIKWWGWATGGVCVLGLLFSAFSWSGSASWYELESAGPQAVRVPSNGPVGKHAMCAGKGRYLVQELPRERAETLQGQTVTVGGWARTDTAPQATFEITLDDGISPYTETMSATSEWWFQALTTTVESQSQVLQVQLSSSETGDTICYDGVIMVQGEFPLDEPPQFESPFAEGGIWTGRPFENLLSNGSGERRWPRLNARTSKLLAKLRLVRAGDPTLYIHSILDWKRTGWVYGAVWDSLWQSFWARFGWNHVALPDPIYPALFALAWLGIGGALIFGFRRLILTRSFHPWQRRSMVLFAVAVLLVWASTMIWYSHPILLHLPRIYFAVARYVYPAIIPTVLFLYLGWRELLPGRLKGALPILSLLGIACLDIASLMGAILPFYYLN